MLAALLLSLSALAADPTPTPSPSPTPAPTPTPTESLDPVTIIRVPGEQIKFALKDGREAVLSIVRRPSVPANVPFGLSETTCVVPDPIVLKCEFEIPAKIQVMRVRWTKNPDATKIGKLVNLGGGTDVDDLIPSSVKQQLDGGVEGAGMDPLILRCDDFTWLTGTKDAPPTFSMAVWNAEIMFPNPETGENENRVYSGHYSPELVRKNDRELTLMKTGSWFSAGDPDSRRWFINSDIIDMVTLPTAKQPSCQYALKPDFSILERQRRDYEKKYQTETPFLDGSDGLFDAMKSNPTSIIYYAMKLPEGVWQ